MWNNGIIIPIFHCGKALWYAGMWNMRFSMKISSFPRPRAKKRNLLPKRHNLAAENSVFVPEIRTEYCRQCGLQCCTQ